MLDPAILALVQHLKFTPPAIVEQVSAIDRPDLAAFERHVEEREEIVSAWIERGANLRAQLWALVRAGSKDLTPEKITELIDLQDRSLEGQLRLAERYNKAALRSEKSLDPELAKQVRRLHDRLSAAVERYYEEGRDLALFLRALRAEIDPTSRGGPSFNSGAELEKYLLTLAG